MTVAKIGGVIAAVPTPFTENRTVDTDAFLEHGRWCLAKGCDLLNVLGTTGEANSLSFSQRRALMATAAKGLDGDRMMVGTGTPDLETTIALTRQAHELGYAAALILPPYYYKPVQEEGLFAWFAKVIQETAETPIAVYLYNFPQLTGIEFSPALAAKLIQLFPERIRGAKDSSGNLDYARQLAQIPGFAVFPSNEATLASAEKDNFAGCISATVNIDPQSSARLWKNQSDRATLDRVRHIRQAIAAHPLIPSVKYLVGKRTRNAIWNNLLPPNLKIAETERLDTLDAIAAELTSVA
ncbi:dihydrodipicolinate synthase family protein [Rhizobium calliandrae]|uniref:Dihydrodipicolinate synthase family protein n=1 Tax=Rhizobium calliandrae TaxID=1312182 RepID=A0ABT7KK45_9HYPH|nr:dihydrodipicolinate synthase family protein [Rhizobium calliandrae]MDL2408542.1 dihydrodipicolinate synthase family protein [Rhizobium calliandrae]